MKQLRDKQPLCYMLPNAHLVTTLPFIDQQLANEIPKSKVAYLIRAEQEAMQKDPQEYITVLKQPTLTYANSDSFQLELQRVSAKFQQADSKPKKKLALTDPPKRLIASEISTVETQVRGNVLVYEHSLGKNINVELYKKFGPLVLRELVEVLQRERSTLAEKIEKEKIAISEANQRRKYMQTESYQREHDIEERIKIMLNKRRKVE